MLPTDPALVFFGESFGASKCFPTARPTKYATVSAAQVIAHANKRNFGPIPPSPCKGTAYDKGNATSSSALELIPAAGSASTSARLPHNVITVSPTTNRKKTHNGVRTSAIGVGEKQWR